MKIKHIISVKPYSDLIVVWSTNKMKCNLRVVTSKIGMQNGKYED